MEKEQILSTLNERLGAEGIKTESFQRTFNDYIAENLPADGAEPDEAYFQKHVRVLKSISGQFSHDLAEAIKGQTKNVAPHVNESPTQNPEPNKEVEEMRKQLAELTKRLDEKESQQTQEQLISRVKAEMKKQGADDDYVLKKTLQGLTLDTKKSVADLVSELMSAYDSELSDCRGKGAAPRNGGPQGGSRGKTEADAFFADKQKKEGWGNSSKKTT